MLNGISIPILIATLLIVFFGMGLHEYGHALMANYWGDPTPRRNGKLTPNPMAHINLAGFAFYTIFALGIVGQNSILVLVLIIVMMVAMQSRGTMGVFALGAVAVNPHLMRNPRWGNFWTSFAGPLMNLAQAIVAAMILRLLPATLTPPLDFIYVLLQIAVTINCIFFVFNILPLAPLDGWNMMYSLLPAYFLRREQVPLAIRKNAHGLSQFLQMPATKWRDWYQLSSYIFLGLFLLSMLPGMPSILGMIYGPPAEFLIRILRGY